MTQSKTVVVAEIDRISNSGNHIATSENSEYNLGELSIGDTESRVLLRIDGRVATKLYAESEWTSVKIDETRDGQAIAEIDDDWKLTVDDEVEYYDLDRIYVDFGNVLKEGDIVQVQVDDIFPDSQRVLASPLLVRGGLYETTLDISKIDEDGRGLIGTQHDHAQIAIREFGGFSPEKTVFKVSNINGSQATGVRYFYPGERLFVTPESSSSVNTCYKELSDERRMVIKDAETCVGRIEVEVIEADYDTVVARRTSSTTSTDGKATEEKPASSTKSNFSSNSPPANAQPESQNDVTSSEKSADTDSLNKVSQDSSSNSPQPEQELGKNNRPQNPENSPSMSGTEADIKNLRNIAMEDSVEEVPKGLSTTTQETSQYSRSEAVRDYVMARADGQCEGCGEPAPFFSKTDEPYLHAHHVQELSDGGSDSPDTVVALCPNCHYRVHHGQDGDAYNEYLIDRLDELEQ